MIQSRIQIPIEDIASLNLHKSQALHEYEHPMQVAGEFYPRRMAIAEEKDLYPPFITNRFMVAQVQVANGHGWNTLYTSFRGRNAPASIPLKSWLPQATLLFINRYLADKHNTTFELEHAGFHQDEIDPMAINLEIRDILTRKDLLMRVHFTPPMIQYGDTVKIGTKEFIVEDMDVDNITLKHETKKGSKREYYEPNAFFKGVELGEIMLVGRPEASI